MKKRHQTRRERIAAILADIPDDVGKLPPPGVELDYEEIAERERAPVQLVLFADGEEEQGTRAA